MKRKVAVPKKAQSSDRTIGTVPQGDEPLSIRLLRAVVESPDTPDNLRLRAAESLLEYEAPKPVGAAADDEPVGKKAAAQKAAEGAATGRLAVPPPPAALRKVVDNS